jgi:hypothetical protein
MYVLKHYSINTYRKIGNLLLRKECNVPIHQAHNLENTLLQLRPLSMVFYYIVILGEMPLQGRCHVSIISKF